MSSCVNGGELGCRCQSGWHSPCPWRRSACCVGTWPCWVLCLWRQRVRMNTRCSRSCCAVGGLPCSRLCWLTCVIGALETLMCSGGVPDPDWIGGVSWKSGHLFPFSGDESSSLCKYGCAGSGSSHCCEQGSGSPYSGLLSSLTPCSESSL